MNHNIAPRRGLLLRLGGCACAGLLWPAAYAQDVLGAKADTKAALRDADRHASEAQSAGNMSASITRSLDSLTSQTDKALEEAEKLQAKSAELSSEIAKLKARKESLLEEYRQGMFCSGCGQTRSQILAKGERFPHPGQSIVRPTPAQIAAKERELQSPITSAERRLDDTRKSLDEQTRRGEAGLEQIRHGVRLWRTAASYADFAWGRVADIRRESWQHKIDTAEQALERVRGLARTKPDLREDVDTWTRLLAKLRDDADQSDADTARRTGELRQRLGAEHGSILGYVRRGKLFARVPGPPGVPIYPSATDGEMGVPYQMGRIPEPGTTWAPLSSVLQFSAAYRSFGAGRTMLSALGANTPPGAAPAANANTPQAPAGDRLLQRLP